MLAVGAVAVPTGEEVAAGVVGAAAGVVAAAVGAAVEGFAPAAEAGGVDAAPVEGAGACAQAGAASRPASIKPVRILMEVSPATAFSFALPLRIPSYLNNFYR